MSLSDPSAEGGREGRRQVIAAPAVGRHRGSGRESEGVGRERWRAAGREERGHRHDVGACATSGDKVVHDGASAAGRAAGARSRTLAGERCRCQWGVAGCRRPRPRDPSLSLSLSLSLCQWERQRRWRRPVPGGPRRAEELRRPRGQRRQRWKPPDGE